MATAITAPEAGSSNQRPQAGPLPSKRGEIGYTDTHPSEAADEPQTHPVTEQIPARHPADRQVISGPTRDPAASPNPDTPPSVDSHDPTASTDASSNRSTDKLSFISFLKPKRIPTIGGVRLTTLITFLAQLAALAATLAGWVLIIRRMNATTPSLPASSSSDGSPTGPNTAQILVHAAFGTMTLAELIFIERTVFRMRAEHYCAYHPGQVLPVSTSRTNLSMGFAPWHRPPLPTYAAALAQSGFGTGDVEDTIIAVPPPPAYGNTRGSTLLLASFRRGGSIRGASQPGSDRRASERSDRPVSRMSERPMSYMSVDPAWEERLDADRAARLEATLAQLEEGTATSSTHR